MITRSQTRQMICHRDCLTDEDVRGGQIRGDPPPISVCRAEGTFGIQALTDQKRQLELIFRDEEAVGSNPAAPTIWNVLKTNELVVSPLLPAEPLPPSLAHPFHD
jgi:hypothetical protein